MDSKTKGGSSIFYPELFGKPIEYYFYPNSSIPVFCPTIEQFRDFEALVAAIEPLAVRGGVCKIIPPKAWRSELERSAQEVRVFADEEFPIMKPIVQHFNGSSGIFHQYNVEYHRKLKLAHFFQISQDDSHRVPDKLKTVEENSSKGDGASEKDKQAKSSTESGTRSGGSSSDQAEASDAAEQRVVDSETVGIAVDYESGKIQLTSTAAEALKATTRSEAMRAKFQPAVASYRPQPDMQGEAAGDSNGPRPPRLFTSDDGRALFVSEKEYAENEELERIYWKNMLFQPPMYGADVLGTLFPEYNKFPYWNIRNLPGLLRQVGQRMPGVNDPYLYLGMWKATFAWHVEDMDLYSINYIHFGAPKAWYAIPIDARSRFEMSMQNVFANDYKNCSQFLRHKAFLLSPRFLAAQGIPFNRVVQRAGEIILTFPLGYHAGYNHGFNCAESVNFALDQWLDVAWESKHCECVKDSVTIDLMEWFGDQRKEREAAKARGHSSEEIVVDDDDMCLRDRVQRDSPRRHAAAAAAIAKSSRVRSGAVASGGAANSTQHAADAKGPAKKADGTASAGTKRKQSVSSARRSEPVAKRLPRKPAKKASLLSVATGALSSAGSKDNELAAEKSDAAALAADVSRRFASLLTPVGACGTCLLPIAGFEGEGEGEGVAVECQQCGLTVHPQCSALAFDDGHYRCANCVMDTDQLSCALCAFQNGLMLPAAQGKSRPEGDGGKEPEFVHFLCAHFINETYFDFPAADEEGAGAGAAGKDSGDSVAAAADDDAANGISTRARTAARVATATKQAIAARTRIPTRKSSAKRSKAQEKSAGMYSSAKVCGIQSISRARYTARCLFCHNHVSSLPGATDDALQKQLHHQCFGPVVQCAHPKCFRSFHPMCAAVHNPALLDWSQCIAFCGRHSQ
ncbi:hypothetical protein EV179_005720 [Coemansia sp. RSA 487]|nr:hypothetical protein EV179_005720 [Coemansia sp. RSA 487]